nr:MAG TPA: Peptidyl-prolyl cis-trans isomerase [Caudoviricetes sp.]
MSGLLFRKFAANFRSCDLQVPNRVLHVSF